MPNDRPWSAERPALPDGTAYLRQNRRAPVNAHLPTDDSRLGAVDQQQLDRLVSRRLRAGLTFTAATLAIYFTFILLIIGVLAITYWAARRSRTTEQIYAAGRSIGGFQNGLALAGDYMSAASFLGISGLVALNGFDGMIYSVGWLVGWPIVLVLIAEPLRRLGKYTFVDVVAYRFRQTPVRIAAAFGTITVVIFYLIAQMVGAGTLIKLMFGIDYRAAIIIVGALMITLVLVGGMVATTWVQTIKAALMLGAGAVLVGLTLSKFGFNPLHLFDAAADKLGNKVLAPGSKVVTGPWDAISLGLALMFGTAGLPHILMRFYTVPNLKAARISVGWTTFWVGLFFLFTVVLGFGGMVLVGQGAIKDVDAGGVRHHPRRGGRPGAGRRRRAVARPVGQRGAPRQCGGEGAAAGRPHRHPMHRGDGDPAGSGAGGPERGVPCRPAVLGGGQRQLPGTGDGDLLAAVHHARRGHQHPGRHGVGPDAGGHRADVLSQRTQEPAPAVQPEQPGPGVYVAGLPQWHRGLTAMAGAGGVRQVRGRGAGDDPGQRRRNTRAVPDAGRAVADVDEVTTGEAIMGRYAEAFRRSIDDPDGFWGEAAKAIDWYRPPTVVLDRSSPPFYRWFTDGVLNTCYNALDRHVAGGRADQLALVYDSPVTGTKRSFTYRQLLADVARFAGVLKSLGVTAGDRVVIYLPMVPEAVVAMLACARIGAVHSVVFGGFAANELAIRIDDAQPKVIVSASCGIEVTRVVEYKPILDRAIELSEHKPQTCVILQRPQAVAQLVPGRDVDWDEAIAEAEPADCVPVAATDPLYILYTSGTTAKPKGVVRDNGGHAVALRWSMEYIYDTHPGEVYWAASDIGWVVGHSYIVYAPLIAGCTTILYEGKPVGTPDAGAFWRVIAEHGVKTLFTAPTAFRAIKKEDPAGEHLAKYDVSGLTHLFLAGERLDPETYHWATDLLGIPVIDHWWQTETGWPIAANPVGLEMLPIKPGSPI